MNGEYTFCFIEKIMIKNRKYKTLLSIYCVSVFLLMMAVYPVHGQHISIKSPDKRLSTEIYIDSYNHLTLELKRNGLHIIHPSSLGIVINEIDYGRDPVILSTENYTIDEQYSWHGNHSTAVNRCEGIKISLKSASQTWWMDVRVYNDGLAFKYSYDTSDSTIFNGESTVLNFSSALNAKYMQHKLGEESKIYSGKISDIGKNKVKRTMPPLLLYPEDMSEYLMVLEGGGFNFHGYSLLPVESDLEDQSTYSLRVDYAEAPNGWLTKGEINTAWKIICTVNTLNELVNTDIVSNVCPAPDPKLFPKGAMEEWIKPGKSTWNWWARVGVDYENQIELVDLAAQMGANYHLVDIGWDSKWKDDTYNSYEYLKKLCDHAASKRIGIFVWKTSDVSFNLEQNKDDPNNKFIKMKGYDVSLDTVLMRQEVERIAKAGAKGIKLDYINSENSKWKAYMENFLKICAENKLMVDFHGCPIPAGESRTYPNEITREAIFGGEKLRGGGGAKKMPTSHYIDLIFTRLIAGHADYTPAIFRDPQGEGFTHAMQLASAMMFTSPLLCWADHPDEYLESEGLEIIKKLPTVWDETIVLDGSNLSKLAVYARRDGSDWYVAGINGLDDRIQNYQLDFHFLKDDKYLAYICFDDIESAKPEIKSEERIVSKGDKIDINMLPSGGFIIQLTKK